MFFNLLKKWQDSFFSQCSVDINCLPYSPQNNKPNSLPLSLCPIYLSLFSYIYLTIFIFLNPFFLPYYSLHSFFLHLFLILSQFYIFNVFSLSSYLHYLSYPSLSLPFNDLYSPFSCFSLTILSFPDLSPPSLSLMYTKDSSPTQTQPIKVYILRKAGQPIFKHLFLTLPSKIVLLSCCECMLSKEQSPVFQNLGGCTLFPSPK
jgi:hypothetical protein